MKPSFWKAHLTASRQALTQLDGAPLIDESQHNGNPSNFSWFFNKDNQGSNPVLDSKSGWRFDVRLDRRGAFPPVMVHAPMHLTAALDRGWAKATDRFHVSNFKIPGHARLGLQRYPT